MDIARAGFVCWVVLSTAVAFSQDDAGRPSWLDLKKDLADDAGGPTGYYSIEDMRELNDGQTVCLRSAPRAQIAHWSEGVVQRAFACVTYRDHQATISGAAIPATDLLKQPDSTVHLPEHRSVRVSFLHDTALKVWL